MYRNDDPFTSQDAFGSIDATRLEALVLDAIRCKPMTSHELAEHLDLSLVTVSPRLRPLVNKGLAQDSGERRRNPSGRNAIVWRAA